MQEFSLLVDIEMVLSAQQKSSTQDLAVAVKLVTYQWQLIVYLYAGTLPVVAGITRINLALCLMVQEHSQNIHILQEGRYDHACSKFVDNNGETVSFNEK